MNFNLDNISQFHLMRNGGQIKPYEVEPGGFDPASIFLKRKNGDINTEENPFKPKTDITAFNENDMKELEDFCKSRGIIGVNFHNMNPKQVLNMLKNKVGIPSESFTTKKSILHG